MTEAGLTGSSFLGPRESRVASGGFRAQDVPDAAQPEELRGENPRGMRRLVDGRLTRDAL